MIPQKKEPKDLVVDDIKKLIHIQQTDKVRDRSNVIKRAERKVNKFFRISTDAKCVCCQRTIRLVSAKHRLCLYCYNWCRQWLIENYMKYDYTKLPLAIVEFRKPVKCRFYDICGNIVPRVSETGFVTKRSGLCSKCAIIFHRGMSQGREQKLRAQLGFVRKRKTNGLSGS